MPFQEYSEQIYGRFWNKIAFKYLVSLCKYPKQKADDSRVEHGVGVETQPGKIHADLHSKVVTDVICGPQ